jgi:ribA/ribD-fused uncharacterized protein
MIYTVLIMRLNPEQFRDPLLDVTGDVVGFYPREFYPLDNFASFQVDWQGRRWPTSEHAYQASIFMETAPEVVELIAEARSAHDAQKIARLYKDRRPENWDEVKISVMEDICRHKLLQNPYVWAKLVQTGDLEIVEDSPKDDFWGWGPNRDGRNELGKIWMRLREEIRSGQLAQTIQA